MGSEARLVTTAMHDGKFRVYDLGKFASTWVEMDWSACDLPAFERRVWDQLNGSDEYASVEGVCRSNGVARDVFAFCVKYAWAVHCVSDEQMFDIQYAAFGQWIEELGEAYYVLEGERYAAEDKAARDAGFKT